VAESSHSTLKVVATRESLHFLPFFICEHDILPVSGSPAAITRPDHQTATWPYLTPTRKTIIQLHDDFFDPSALAAIHIPHPPDVPIHALHPGPHSTPVRTKDERDRVEQSSAISLLPKRPCTQRYIDTVRLSESPASRRPQTRIPRSKGDSVCRPSPFHYPKLRLRRMTQGLVGQKAACKRTEGAKKQKSAERIGELWFLDRL
jgi:hypothetical protein